MKFIDEIKRRHVHKFAGIYIVISWLLLQVADVVAPIFEVAPWVLRLIFIMLVIGFPIAVILSWMYDIRREGIVRDEFDARRSTIKLASSVLFSISVFLSASYYTYFQVSQGRAIFELGGREIQKNSIAVLPFANLSVDPSQNYFADGLAEDILNNLAQIPDLFVTSRSSSFSFKEQGLGILDIGAQLGVANVLEGSVRRSGQQLRITAQLIDTRTEQYLWSESFDRSADDLFAVQDEISRAIVEALKPRLDLPIQTPTLNVGTDSVEAHDEYLMGRYLYIQRTEESLTEALDYFRRAVEIDPNYAPAWSGLADTYAFLSERNYGSMPHIESLARARPVAERALRLNPDLAEAHATAYFLMEMAGEVGDDFSHLERAIELNPNFARAYFWLGNAYWERGSYDKAFEAYRSAQTLDPQSILNNFYLARAYAARGDGEELKRLSDVIVLIDADHDLALLGKLMVAEFNDDYPEIIRRYQQLISYYNDPLDLLTLADQYARLGLSDKVTEIAQSLSGTSLSPWAEFLAENDEVAVELSSKYPVSVSDAREASLRVRIDLLVGRYTTAINYYNVLGSCNAESFDITDCIMQAYAYKAAGRQDEFNSALRQIKDFVEALEDMRIERWNYLDSFAPMSYIKASINILEDRPERALERYEELVEDGFIFFAEKHEPFFEPMRKTNEWSGLLRKVDVNIRARREALENSTD